MPRSMRQIVFPAPERAELLERPAAAPGARDVAGPTLASVVSAGTELGMQYRAATGHPHEPGYGAVFEVREVGGDVADLAAGDRVFCIGKHASWQCVPADEVVAVPRGLAPEAAVLARMAAIGWSCLTRTAARPPGVVLVTGLGAVGHFAARLFAGAGYTVLAVDPDPARRALLGRFCACPVLRRVPVNDPAWQDRVEAAIECAGRERAVYDACCLVRKGGEVFLVGVPWTGDGAPARDILWKVFWRYLHLRSGWEWEIPWHATAFRAGSYRENCAAILRQLADGTLRVAGLYRTARPRECQAAYQALLHGRTDALCTVFDWREAGPAAPQPV